LDPYQEDRHLWAGHSLAAHNHLAAQRRGVKESKKKRREGERKEGRHSEPPQCFVQSLVELLLERNLVPHPKRIDV